MKRLLLSFLLLAAYFSQAQNTPLPVDNWERAKSQAQAAFERITPNSDGPLMPDKAFKFSVIVTDAKTLTAVWHIHPDYYLYHDKFSITVQGADTGAITFPKGKIKNDPLFGKVAVHKHKVEVAIPLENVQTSNITLIAKYQGCWEGGVCYPPQEKTLKLTLPATEAKTPKKTTLTPISTPNQTGEINTLFQQNIFWILMSFFGFGLLLSFTPCVFPMVPILSGIIIGQKKEVSTKKALAMSLVFVLAMSVTYAIAGVLAGYFGENLQILFQTPWILVLFSLVFVFLAFSMFGFYDIQLPANIQNKITNLSNKQEGGHLLSVAIMGFLSALIIGPCVAPPLAGALIYIGQTGDALLGGMSLLMMGLGMGAPLLAVGAGVSKLPKAGSWMENVKAVFGILMLAVAIYLLDRVVSELTSLILWAALFSIAPIAMGVLNAQTEKSTPWERIFRAVGLLILGYGILLWGLVARGGGDMLAPLSGYGSTQTAQAHVEFERIKSFSDLNQVLSMAEQEKKIVVLDFYADWCIACKEIERFVFSNPKVLDAMRDVVAIQADVTKNDAIDKALMKQLGVIGPPTILFFKNGVESYSQRIIGEINAQGFLQRLGGV